MIKLSQIIKQSQNPRLGKCYQLSYQYVMKHPEWILVHGYITDILGKTGRTIDHAWVEKQNKIYDLVLNKSFSKQVYYSMFGVENPIEYNQKQIMKNSLKYKTYGPWHKIDSKKIKFP